MHVKNKTNNSSSDRALFHEREIWGCKLGENIGFEQDGKGDSFLRPVLILRKFNQEVLWTLPLTTAKKENHPYYFNFSFQENVQSSAILSQIRLIDAKRLNHQLGYMNKSDFTEVKKKLKELLP
jgi:mRNA interferase MazF